MDGSGGIVSEDGGQNITDIRVDFCALDSLQILRGGDFNHFFLRFPGVLTPVYSDIAALVNVATRYAMGFHSFQWDFLDRTLSDAARIANVDKKPNMNHFIGMLLSVGFVYINTHHPGVDDG